MPLHGDKREKGRVQAPAPCVLYTSSSIIVKEKSKTFHRKGSRQAGGWQRWALRRGPCKLLAQPWFEFES